MIQQTLTYRLRGVSAFIDRLDPRFGEAGLILSKGKGFPDQVVALYYCAPEQLYDNIVFSELGLSYFAKGEWRLLRYTDLSHTTIPDVSRRYDYGLNVHLVDGRQTQLPVKGETVEPSFSGEAESRSKDVIQMSRAINEIVKNSSGK